MSIITRTDDFSSAKVTRPQVIESARKFVGLPYRTQGRETTGEFRGTDCGGLILLIGQDLNLSDLEVLGYANAPDGETFERLLSEHLDIIPDEDVRPGDILGCDYGDGVQHTVLVVATEPKIKVIHAKRGLGVTEQWLNGKDLRGWKATYRIRTLEENDA